MTLLTALLPLGSRLQAKQLCSWGQLGGQGGRQGGRAWMAGPLHWSDSDLTLRCRVIFAWNFLRALAIPSQAGPLAVLLDGPWLHFPG